MPALRRPSIAGSVKRLGRQFGSLFNERHNGIDLGIAERGDEVLRRTARDCIDLHELQLAAGSRDFVQAIAKCFQFRRAWRLAVDAHEERLDDERANLRGGRDVFEDLLKWDCRPIDELEVVLRPRFELSPDFAVVFVENGESLLTCGR
jgi:hypothetical protein